MTAILLTARNTLREVLRQPAFLITLALGCVGLLLGRYLTLFGLGAEVEMYKDIGTSTVLFVGILLVIFSSTSSIYDEIENRTILTILSRPVTRSQLLIGKFAGIVVTVFIAFVLLLAIFLVTHWWFLKFEYSHSDKMQPLLHPQIIKAVALAFMEVSVLAGVSVILSIFFGLLPNFAICGMVFVVGHLSDYIFSLFRDPITGKMAVLPAVFHTILPNFEHFNVSNALMNGSIIPIDYVLTAAVYTVCYLLLLLIAGTWLFQRRELI